MPKNLEDYLPKPMYSTAWGPNLSEAPYGIKVRNGCTYVCLVEVSYEEATPPDGEINTITLYRETALRFNKGLFIPDEDYFYHPDVMFGKILQVRGRLYNHESVSA